MNLLTAFERADAQMLEGIKKSGDLGLYLINAISRIATNLNMVDIQPLEIREKKEKQEIKEEVKEDVDKDALQSETQQINVDLTGAPDLMGD